jgi:hypothetical protein
MIVFSHRPSPRVEVGRSDAAVVPLHTYSTLVNCGAM